MKHPGSIAAAIFAALLAVVLSPGIAQAGTPSTGAWYAFDNPTSGFWAAVSGARTDSGAPVIQWSGPYVPGTITYRNEQQWQVYDPDGDQWFYLINANGQKVMAVSGGATANGSKVIQWDRESGHTEQQWTFLNTPRSIYPSNTPNSDEAVYLQNRKSGRCLAIAGGNAGTSVRGQQLIIWDCHNVSNKLIDDQIWWLTRTA